MNHEHQRKTILVVDDAIKSSRVNWGLTEPAAMIKALGSNVKPGRGSRFAVPLAELVAKYVRVKAAISPLDGISEKEAVLG